MSDRELLEAAARAAGIMIDKSPYNGGGAGNTGFDVMGNAVLDWHNDVKWNPLADDGDALRLALDLDINLAAISKAVAWDDPGRHAAMRRAIVRAAATLAEPTDQQEKK